jgi:hypothetical protein
MPQLKHPAIPPRGNASVWVYDHPQSSPEAQFDNIITSFNEDAATVAPMINHVIVHGSEVKISYSGKCCTPAGDTKKVGRSLTETMSRCLEQHADASNDAILAFIIDGCMDGGEAWSPNLSKLAAAEIVDWS